MGKRLAAALLILALFCQGCSPSPSPSPSSGSPAALSQRERDWAEDLDFFREKYEELHPDPFYFRSEEEFHWELSRLKGEISRLTDEAVSFELCRILAGMGDGHSFVALPDSVRDRGFPVKLRFFGEELCLCSYAGGHEEFAPYLLNRVVSIGGADAAFLRKKAEELIQPGNAWSGKELFPFYFSPAFLEWAGCPAVEGGCALGVLDEDGRAREIPLPVLSGEELDGLSWTEPESFSSLPYLRGGNWAEYRAEENAVVLCFSEMGSREGAPYEALFEETLKLLRDHPGCGLLIDLRSHPGGLTDPLEYVRQYARLFREALSGPAYVAVGGFTASAGVETALIFRRELNALLIGEPTGQFHAFFAATGFVSQFTLPHSGLECTVSTEWVDGKEPESILYDRDGKLYPWENTVLPDVYLSNTLENARQGRDPVLEWIRKQ